MSELHRSVNPRVIVAWVQEQIQQGVPRWPLYLKLSKMLSESDELEEIQALSEIKGSIEHEIAARNLKGIQLEKQGKEEQAIALYEANVSDRIDGSHPYNRLRILYKNRGDYDNAIRVCEAYISYGGSDENLCESFRAEINKLKSRLPQRNDR